MNTFNFVCLLSIVFLIKNYLNFNNITIDYNKNYKKYNIYEMFNFHNLIENII
jgi:hypothetical protein